MGLEGQMVLLFLVSFQDNQIKDSGENKRESREVVGCCFFRSL